MLILFSVQLILSCFDINTILKVDENLNIFKYFTDNKNKEFFGFIAAFLTFFLLFSLILYEYY